jgi:hypothetical protein
MKEFGSYMESFDSEIWRWKHYICEDVDVVLKRYPKIVTKVYRKYSGRYTKPGRKKFMALEEF